MQRTMPAAGRSTMTTAFLRTRAPVWTLRSDHVILVMGASLLRVKPRRFGLADVWQSIRATRATSAAQASSAAEVHIRVSDLRQGWMTRSRRRAWLACGGVLWTCSPCSRNKKILSARRSFLSQEQEATTMAGSCLLCSLVNAMVGECDTAGILK